MSGMNRRGALKATAVAGAVATASLALGPGAAQAQPHNRSLNILRAEAGEEACKETIMIFLVTTGSDSPAIATMADNDGFPHVKTLYARGVNHERYGRGVQVTLQFEGPAKGKSLAVNVLQADVRGMRGIRVIPLV
jgi:hypothetical protein